MSDSVEDDDSEQKVRSVKTAYDLQRLKLEKLLKQPDKPAYIPDKPKERKMPKPPEFIRNTWGSSAGAGSGDFHVYRGVRRREYARQKFLDEKEAKATKDEAYQKKLAENAIAAEERTAKKRAKRMKKKNAKQKKKTQVTHVESESESEDENEAVSDLKALSETGTGESQVREDTGSSTAPDEAPGPKAPSETATDESQIREDTGNSTAPHEAPAPKAHSETATDESQVREGREDTGNSAATHEAPAPKETKPA